MEKETVADETKPEPIRIPEEIIVVLADLRWVHWHAKETEEGWQCKTCNSYITAAPFRRTWWEDPRMPCGGFGDVPLVWSLYCPTCQPEPELQYGEGIYAQETFKVKGRDFCAPPQ